jgi:hypothetical protein
MRRYPEFLSALIGQAIERTASDLCRLQPAVFRQAKYRRTNQSLADAEFRHRLNQAAQPHRSAARRDGISKDSGYQRTGAQCRAGTEFIYERLAGGISTHRGARLLSIRPTVQSDTK